MLTVPSEDNLVLNQLPSEYCGLLYSLKSTTVPVRQRDSEVYALGGVPPFLFRHVEKPPTDDPKGLNHQQAFCQQSLQNETLCISDYSHYPVAQRQEDSAFLRMIHFIAVDHHFQEPFEVKPTLLASSCHLFDFLICFISCFISRRGGGEKKRSPAR